MDHYDQIVVQRGEQEAFAIAVDDARKLRRRLSLVRLMAATAAAVELIRRGCEFPQFCSWKFDQGWSGLIEQMRLSSANQGCDACEAVCLIAEMQALDSDAERCINQARQLKHILREGFIPPDPCPSEDYERGWEAACKAFRESRELCLLCEALADVEDQLTDEEPKTQGRQE
jgi:hypothetical protein